MSHTKRYTVVLGFLMLQIGAVWPLWGQGDVNTSLELPRSITYSEEEQKYIPDPFEVKFHIHTGDDTVSIKYFELLCSDDDFITDPSYKGNEKHRDATFRLIRGSGATVYWYVKPVPDPSPRRRPLSVICVLANGDTLSREGSLDIPAGPADLECSLELDRDTLKYDAWSQTYPVSTVNVRATLDNRSGDDMTDIWVRTAPYLDQQHFMGLNTGVSNDSIQTLALLRDGESASFEWQYILQTPNLQGRPLPSDIALYYGANGVEEIYERCIGTVYVQNTDRKFRIGQRYPSKIDTPDTPDTTAKLPGKTRTAGSQFLKVGKGVPGALSLAQNYPNPFNPTTEIVVDIPTAMHVTLVVYDPLGKEVAELVNEWKSPGTYRVQFDAAGLPAGIYVYRLETAPGTLAKKMVVVK